MRWRTLNELEFFILSVLELQNEKLRRGSLKCPVNDLWWPAGFDNYLTPCKKKKWKIIAGRYNTRFYIAKNLPLVEVGNTSQFRTCREAELCEKLNVQKTTSNNNINNDNNKNGCQISLPRLPFLHYFSCTLSAEGSVLGDIRGAYGYSSSLQL